MLGTFMTDINLGIFTAKLDPAKCIYASSEQLRIHHHHYQKVQLAAFINELAKQRPLAPKRPFTLDPNARITITRMFARLNEQLSEDTIVIADIGDALFAATELVIHGRTEFLSPAYYTSMGFAIPAAVGAQTAKPAARLVVICGDGAFQMTGQELSTIAREGYDPVIIVLGNGGYGTERKLRAGEWEFNDIHPWNYSKLPEVYGGGTGYQIKTEEEFDSALQIAWGDRDAPSVLRVFIGQDDHSQTLNRLAERMSKHV